MGGNSSKSSVEQTNEFFNKTTSSFISENSQKVSASSINVNSIKLANAKIKGCAIRLNQSIDSTTVATGDMKTETVEQLTAKLKNDSKTAIENAAAQKNGFLAPSFGNSAEATTKLTTKVTNIIENTMNSKNVQDIFAAARNNNAADLSGLELECFAWMSPEDRVLNVDQAIKSSIMAKGVSSALTKALTEVIAENTTDTAVKQSATQTNAGVDDLVSAWFAGLAGIYGVIALIVIMCCCCCCCALIGVVAMGAGGGDDVNMNIPKPAMAPGGITLSAAPPVPMPV